MSRIFFARTALRATVPSGVTTSPVLARSFSSLPGLRPSTIQPTPAFTGRPTTAFPQSRFMPALLPTTTTTTEASAADLIPTSAISAHPALMQSQIRCGPRRYQNMNRPSRLIRQRRHGFLSRIRTKTGRKMLARRHSKQRKTLSA